MALGEPTIERIEKLVTKVDIAYKEKGAGMNIYLLRHGQTDWNLEGRIQGHTDIPLNRKGRLQIAQTAKGLAGICPNIDLIICSPLSRARESAEIAAKDLHYPIDQIVVEPMLIERCFGEAEGMEAKEREKKYPNYQYSDTGYRFPGIEEYEDLMKRANSAFQKIVITYNDKENILVVSHGAILAAVITVVTNGKIPYFSDAVSLDSGSLFHVCYTEGTVELARYGIDGSGFSDIHF